MRGITKRIAWVLILLSFAAFGFLCLSVGFAYNLLPFGTVTERNEFLQFVGVVIFVVTVFLGIISSIYSRMDSVDIPIKKISYVQVQNKVLLILDGKVFEKISIEWINVYLKNVRRRANRNFYYLVLEDEIYIGKPNEVNYLESEENLIAKEQTMETDENPEESFKMSGEDKNG